MSPAATTRWCPTPEQLMILEEMYRGGVKTPNASQIQQITAHLSLYGKIEGKNVFYWFQNHKARDRQKLRRKLSRQQQVVLHQQPIHNQHHHLLHHFEAPPSLGFQQFHYFNSPQFLSQEGLQEASINQTMNYTWKVENTQVDQMDKWMRAYGGNGDNWMMMDMGTSPNPSPCFNNKPLKTLELFPIKSSTSLKDECTTSANLQNLSNTKTTN